MIGNETEYGFWIQINDSVQMDITTIITNFQTSDYDIVIGQRDIFIYRAEVPASRTGLFAKF